MKSGLEGRDNTPPHHSTPEKRAGVSMKSGLEGRNNSDHLRHIG